MDSIICPGCKLSVEPIKLFDRSKKTGKSYFLIQCPRERCKFFIDIESLPDGWQGSPKGDTKSETDDKGRSFWRYGL